jgi:hypothetical protein
MNKYILVLTVALTLHDRPLAQTNQNLEGAPVIGWDSLKSLIVFPEIPRRAGVQGNARVDVQIDSAGNVTATNVYADTLFIRCIDDVVKKVKWYPRYSKGKSYSTITRFHILFQFKQRTYDFDPSLLIIEADMPRMN